MLGKIVNINNAVRKIACKTFTFAHLENGYKSTHTSRPRDFLPENPDKDFCVIYDIFIRPYWKRQKSQHTICRVCE